MRTLPSILPILILLLSAPAALGADPRDEAVRLNEEGIRLTEAGKYTEAIRVFTRARSLMPLDATLRKNLSVAHSRYGISLVQAERFEAVALEALMQEFVADEGIKIGQVIHALRVAVTGKTVGFGMFEILAILGRTHCLARIDRALARL